MPDSMSVRMALTVGTVASDLKAMLTIEYAGQPALPQIMVSVKMEEAGPLAQLVHTAQTVKIVMLDSLLMI